MGEFHELMLLFVIYANETALLKSHVKQTLPVEHGVLKIFM